MNILSEDINRLARLDYRELLGAILTELKQNNLFQWSPNGEDRLNLNIHKIAHNVAQKTLSSPLISTFGSHSATINLSNESDKVFKSEIIELYRILRDYLESSPPSKDIKQAISHLVRNLSDLKETTGDKAKLGFKYNFPGAFSLTQQRLKLDNNHKGGDSTLKLHLLTINVRDIKGFENNLYNSIENHLSSDPALSIDDQEELKEKLEDLRKNEKSDFHRLKNLVYQETVGKLKREAKILYLEYLKENIPNPRNGNIIYLEDLIRRLRLLDQYLNDPNKADGDYDVSYGGTKVNYKEQFGWSEILNPLPIIPIVEGNLGETTQPEQGKKEFIFSLRMKLNGSVPTQAKNLFSLNYYLQLLDPDSEEHQKRFNDEYKSESFKRKVLQVCLLYFFVFASRNDPDNSNYQAELEYDPISNFEQHCLPILRGNDDEAKKGLFRKIKKGFTKFNIEKKVQRLKTLIKENLAYLTILPQKNWSIHLGLEKSLLKSPRDILTEGKFFKPDFSKSKEYLRYITVYDAQVEENNLCHLPVNITIEDIRYLSTNEYQNFSLNYDLKNLKTIPIVIWNYQDNKHPIYKMYNDYFKSERLISIPYNAEELVTDNFKKGNESKAFFYKFTFSLLIYISLKVIIDKVEDRERLFFPIMRLQQSSGDDPTVDEEFMRDFSKTLAHLLSDEILANSQGFNIKKFNLNKDFNIKNSLASLYSTLPKVFEVKSYRPELDRLGIIVVSSRESDRKRGDNDEKRLSSLIGEVITVDIQGNLVTVKNLKTFSENYDKVQMYKSPNVVINTVADLYQKGYRHIFYIAKTPYSSTLKLDQNEGDDFFMSKSVIGSLKEQREDLKIYPIFFDKYSVKRMQKLTTKKQALYIKDAREMNTLLNDSSKKTVIFFNLFSGITVGKEEERFYNGVMSYSTLLNVYEGILEEQDIRDALIHDSENNQLKTDLLNYLTLFHFARYESPLNPSIKLDPYENIIGDESVGKSSIFPHTDKKTNFNSLAFLTEVRRIINVKENQ